MTADTVHYFGYGSLVNRATRPAGETAAAARLHGWRRAWNHRVAPSRERSGCTALSIDPVDPGDGSGPDAIDGVIVPVRAEALAALDAREANYDRLALPAGAFSSWSGGRADGPGRDAPGDDVAGVDLSGVDTVFVYRSRRACRRRADARHPVLLSYVDCVMAGYLERFGPAGLDAWLATTTGWDAPLADDRAAPRYPRAVALAPALLARFDALLAPHRPPSRAAPPR